MVSNVPLGVASVVEGSCAESDNPEDLPRVFGGAPSDSVSLCGTVIAMIGKCSYIAFASRCEAHGARLGLVRSLDVV